MYGELAQKTKTVPRPNWYFPVPYATGLNPGYAFVHPANSSTVASQTLALNRLYAIPWAVPNDIILLDVGLDINSNIANSVIRLGLYYDNNVYPGALFQDFGINSSAVTISGAQNQGVYFLGGLTVPLVVPAGFYWFAYVSQGAGAGVRAMNSGILYNLTFTAQPATGVFASGWYHAGISGVLPTTFTTSRNFMAESPMRILIKIR